MMTPSSLRRDDGFTLLEVLVVLTISSGLILLGVSILRNVAQVAQASRNGERDWVTELFLRRQMSEADVGLIKRFSLARLQSDEFTFVTRRSGQMGELGLPALVTWKFNPGLHELRYREIILPPWWTPDASHEIDAEQIAYSSSLDQWQGVIFSNVSSMQFQYWDKGRLTWTSSLPDSNEFPSRIRMDIVRDFGSLNLVLETSAALSSFLSSGSSSAVP